MRQEKYDEIVGINFSSLKHMEESPKSYRWHRENPQETTPAMAFGTALHAAILEPDRFEADFIMQPGDIDLRTKAGKEWRSEQLEAKKTIVSSQDMSRIEQMRRNFCSHDLIRPFLDQPGDAEITLVWDDAETGMPCKGRLDRLLHDGSIFGVKTTSKFNARQFQSHAWEMAYHAQWAFYYDGAIANGIDVPIIAEGVVATSGPFDAALYIVDKGILERGRTLYRGWLRTLAECLETDKWPGQYPEALTFRAPAWAGTGEYDLEHSIGAFVDALKKEVQI